MMTYSARVLLGVALLSGLILSLCGQTSARPPAEVPIRVEKIKYADLGKLIRSQRGKVVIVDVWADFCVPCKREFPNLVALHNKYKDEGLVAVYGGQLRERVEVGVQVNGGLLVLERFEHRPGHVGLLARELQVFEE